MFRKLTRDLSLCAAAAILAGCGAGPSSVIATGGSSASTSTGSTSSTPPIKPSAPATSITQPSIYYADDTTGPINVDIVAKSATSAVYPLGSISGISPSVDAAGNIYVYDYSAYAIKEYSPAAITGAPLRSLPVGPGSNIAGVVDVMASQTGEIYIYDGSGIAVFSATANGSDKPVRYLSVPAPGVNSYETFTVDRAGLLYVSNTPGTIYVYGASASGTAAPIRTIHGPSTNLSGLYAAVPSLATDASGNLYALCSCSQTNGSAGVNFPIYEFSSTASGDVAPIIASFMDPAMYPYFGDGNGIAVGTDGTIYAGGGTVSNTSSQCTIFVFAPNASGATSANSRIGVYGCSDSPESRIAIN